MYLDSWLRLRCDHCHKINWLNNGDVSDQTVPDVGPSIRCWACHEIFQVDGDMEDDIDYPDRLDHDYAEQGLELPT